MTRNEALALLGRDFPSVRAIHSRRPDIDTMFTIYRDGQGAAVSLQHNALWDARALRHAMRQSHGYLPKLEGGLFGLAGSV